MTSKEKAELIRQQNDLFRTGIPNPSGVSGRVVLTQGIHELIDPEMEPEQCLADLFKTIRNFDDFDQSNDPHSEHDFGAFTFLGQKCFWKFDYYTPDLKWGSENPSDLSKTMRVLTIMLTSEY